jgi:hypothetical protein
VAIDRNSLRRVRMSRMAFTRFGPSQSCHFCETNPRSGLFLREPFKRSQKIFQFTSSIWRRLRIESQRARGKESSDQTFD